MTETLQRKFVKPSCISQSLKCAICSQVYIQATRLYCSHTFCNECIKQCLKSRNNCPICRVTIDRKNMGPDRIAQNIINQLEVFCPVQDCPWKGMNCELEAHYEKCEWRNRDREVKTGKSHKKVKTFNIDMFKDEQVEEKINFNQFKGSLGARIGMGVIKSEPRQTNEGKLKSTDTSKKEQQNKESKDKGNYDFLENLLFG